MAENSGIEWTDHTFNPWIGCTKVSPACDHCYAEAWAERYEDAPRWGAHAVRRRTSEANWSLPFKWDIKARIIGKRARVFCASLADVFDNSVHIHETWRQRLWETISKTPNLDWLLLTKRPQNIFKYIPQDWGDTGYKNVWLGTTVENQEEADRRIPALLKVPARVHFLSCEPLLGPISLRWLSVFHENAPATAMRRYPQNTEQYDGMRRIDWVICGGESGPLARAMHPDWARQLRDQCQLAGVPFLFKQWGEWAPDTLSSEQQEHYELSGQWDGVCRRIGKKKAGRLLDGQLHDDFPMKGAL